MADGGHSALYEKGLAMRRAVLGADYVDRSLKSADTFTEPFQKLVTEWCWGEIWNRPGLDRKTRSLINLAMLTALNRPNEVRLHVRGALNNGATREEIREVLLQTTVYCGVPAALESFRIASEVLKEEDAKRAG
jgi:4-carboxymuconolactone decarboxylase